MKVKRILGILEAEGFRLLSRAEVVGAAEEPRKESAICEEVMPVRMGIWG